MYLQLGAELQWLQEPRNDSGENSDVLQARSRAHIISMKRAISQSVTYLPNSRISQRRVATKWLTNVSPRSDRTRLLLSRMSEASASDPGNAGACSGGAS